MLDVFVPTRGRINRQLTAEAFQLVKVWKAKDSIIRLRFAVPRCEVQAFRAAHPSFPVTVVEDDWKFGSICQNLLQRSVGDYWVCIDDDFTLYRRRDPKNPSQKGSRVKDLNDCKVLFDHIFYWFLQGYAHGGVSMRQANHYCEDASYLTNGRICGLSFYRRDIVLGEGLQFNKVEEHQGFHVSLDLLELGYESLIDYEFMFGHAGTNAAGGCSTYRTVDFLQEQSDRIKELHPEGVHPFYRKLKGEAAQAIAGPEGIPAVRVSWKKSIGTRRHERKLSNTVLKRKGIRCIGL